MLVMTRKPDQKIVITDESGTGETITITILEVRGDSIRIGIDAPFHIKAHRQEVADEIAATNLAASLTDDAAEAGLRNLFGSPHAPGRPRSSVKR